LPFPLQPSDLRATARLVIEATLGVTALVEQVHARAATLPGLKASERTGGLTGGVYAGVRGVTRLVGGGLDLALGSLEPALRRLDPELPSDEREALRAVLNGVLGDHLDAQSNPLAVPMQLQAGGAPSPRGVLLLLHGLCMNPRQWRKADQNLGEALAAPLGLSPVWLHYNTGLPIARNGAELAAQLEAFADRPRLVLVGHSMGGLVARSALEQAGERRWPARVSDLVCLGSPHGGAPLERIGHGVDQLLAALPYAAPFTKLSRLRSAGILDLREGSATPLPESLRSHAIAGRLPGTGRMLGDGLVTVASALGQRAGLRFTNTRVIDGLGHIALMHDPAVRAQLIEWLS
jgi:pimeloyl-ACP methyl ester carboxylesterase